MSSFFIIALVIIALRFVIARLSGDPVFRWSLVPVAWVAVVVCVLASSGCLDDVSGQRIDAGDLPDTALDALASSADAQLDARPVPPLLNVQALVGPDGADSYVSVYFWVTCPTGVPNGPYLGEIEHHTAAGVINTQTFLWVCASNWRMVTTFDVPCGLEVWGSATITSPINGAAVTVSSTHTHTLACAP